MSSSDTTGTGGDPATSSVSSTIASSVTGGGAGGALASSSSVGGSSTSSGPCITDADGDTFISAVCSGGNDCADGDKLANPNGDYHSFPIKNPPPGTPSYDFNCNGKEELEITTKLDCTAIPCNTTIVAWTGVVPACGVVGQLGVCKLGIASCDMNVQGSQQQKCR